MTEGHDPVTGEVMDDTIHVPTTLRRIEDNEESVPRSGRNVASIIALLENGDFNAEMGEDMRELVQVMETHANTNKGTAKGKITITLDVMLANGIFVITGGHTVKKPVAKRLGTPLFAREDGALGLNPAGQYRSIGHQGSLRDVTVEQQVREPRDHAQVRDI